MAFCSMTIRGLSRSAQRVAAEWGAWAVAGVRPQGVRVARWALAGASAGERGDVRDACRDVYRGRARSTAAIERLDYLFELGITHIEVMPVAAFPGDRGWGYDGVALFAVTENYGGPDGLKRFVDACHVRGLAVVLDVVYNHFGPVGNYAGKFGPYLTDRAPHAVGRCGELRGRGQRRGAALLLRQRADVDARLPHRWAAAGCGA